MKRPTKKTPGRSRLTLAQKCAAEQIGRDIYAKVGLSPHEITLDAVALLCRRLGAEVYRLPGSPLEFEGMLRASRPREGGREIAILLADHLDCPRKAAAVCLHEYAHAVLIRMIESPPGLAVPAGGSLKGRRRLEFEETVACACEAAFYEAGGRGGRTPEEAWKSCGWPERAREGERKHAGRVA